MLPLPIDTCHPLLQVPGMAGMGVPPNYAMPASYMQQFAAAQAQTEQLRRFWVEMKEEAGRAGTDPLEFKNQQLPLARIKKASDGLCHQMSNLWQASSARPKLF